MNDMKGPEPIKTTVTEGIKETLHVLKAEANSICNRIQSACERVGVRFDPEEARPDDRPPLFGSLNQIHEEIREIGSIIQDCDKYMHHLETFV